MPGVMFGGIQAGQYSPDSEAWWWQHHSMGIFYSRRNWQTSQDKRKDECSNKLRHQTLWSTITEEFNLIYFLYVYIINCNIHFTFSPMTSKETKKVSLNLKKIL